MGAYASCHNRVLALPVVSRNEGTATNPDTARSGDIVTDEPDKLRDMVITAKEYPMTMMFHSISIFPVCGWGGGS